MMNNKEIYSTTMNKILIILLLLIMSSCAAHVPQCSKSVDTNQHQTRLIFSPSVQVKYNQANKRILNCLKKSEKVNRKRKKKIDKEWANGMDSCWV